MSLSDHDACVLMNMISGVGAIKAAALVSFFGSPSAVFDSVSLSDLVQVQGISQNLAQKILDWKNIRLDDELALAQKAGVSIYTRFEDEYPPMLKEIHDPPICLYVKGSVEADYSRSIGVVGSRRMTSYGRAMAKHLSESASYAGWIVISGLAYGIDAVAHQSVVDAGGRTFAVLGSGLARIQPQDHIPLARQILEKDGAIVSEFPMEFSATKHSFPMRNRIISGMSRAVLVVEAGLGSGALITAAQALDQGRVIFSVPGQADNPQAHGTNSLIKQGARLTESFDDVLEEFEFLPGFSSLAETVSGDPTKVCNLQFAEDERLILQALTTGTKSFDDLVTETDLDYGKLLASLMKLEMAKVIKPLPGKYYALA